ncbi:MULTISPECIES: cysteine-rich small domain-containing protein [unclassified Adlercreutzia]|uniref:cysteine-rich small domain-containing protein n=1 Tax=unclassified Adlercreutzia TaxID=2636013 RepID=UPI001F14C770|nr:MULTISPECIES: cysteine-rich small domain-containing protein [unclassified Adlercreutzia]
MQPDSEPSLDQHNATTAPNAGDAASEPLCDAALADSEPPRDPTLPTPEPLRDPALADPALPTPEPLRDPALPFFTNRDCPYFPCHEGVDPRDFNCLFCFCPLYALGPSCGGRFAYVGDDVKDCSGCSLPHEGSNGNALVSSHFAELAKLAHP